MGPRRPTLDLEAGGDISLSEHSPLASKHETKVEPDDASSDSDIDRLDDSDDEVPDDFGLDDDTDSPVSNSNLTIRQCECYPDNETKEDCQARIARIVSKQRNCYGISIAQNVI